MFRFLKKTFFRLNANQSSYNAKIERDLVLHQIGVTVISIPH